MLVSGNTNRHEYYDLLCLSWSDLEPSVLPKESLYKQTSVINTVSSKVSVC